MKALGQLTKYLVQYYVAVTSRVFVFGIITDFLDL